MIYFFYALMTLSLFFGVVRLLKGPSILNRIIAFDAISVSIIGIIIIFSIEQRISYFLELILVFSLLGFVTTVALIDYLFRTKKSEIHDELE
ncbi:Monovalent cation/H+ antiporter subunit F [Chlamydiales bacterium STE3]|nr:Monovalent cation/H+ antiporter subunit F [Chlamydiales bacterium STE3]